MKFDVPTAFLVMLLLLFSFQRRATSEGEAPCSTAEAQKAEEEAGYLKDWGALHSSFKRYSRCDDGAIAEGYSDSVAKLLANHWSDLRDLSRLAARDNGFKAFVLRHIDETMSEQQATLIERNATTNCPANGRLLCRSILQRLHSFQ